MSQKLTRVFAVESRWLALVKVHESLDLDTANMPWSESGWVGESVCEVCEGVSV